MTTYTYLTDTYATETLKTLGIWDAFTDAAVDYRPHAKSRTVLEQFEHQVLGEARWLEKMFGIDTGDPLPLERTRPGFIAKYRADADLRLALLREQPDAWWQEAVPFFDVTRTRVWIFTRRLLHSAHHRAELVVYLRLLDLPIPSVYGPTADTDGEVKYRL